MPGIKKPVDRRQRAKGGRLQDDLGVVLAIDGALEVPDPVPAWLAATRQSWEVFWRSPHTGLLIEADIVAVVRLFSLYDLRERSLRRFLKELVSTGSTGQEIVSPFAAEVHACDRGISPLEDRLGITPMARLKLGVKLGEARQALADTWDEADTADDDDPRLRAVTPIHPDA